jgi:hypothetical protein
VGDLFRGLHREISLATLDDPRSAALVEGVLGVEKIAVVVDEPAHAPLSTRLLVGCGDEDHVSRQLV